MKTSTKQILKIMNVLSWIVFVCLCIRAGAILFSCFVSLFINPNAAKDLYIGLNLSGLREFGGAPYLVMVGLIISLSVLKAFMFYRVIKIFMKINFVRPFSLEIAKLISGISYVAVGIGGLATLASVYCVWLAGKGILLKTLAPFVTGGPEFLFLGSIVFVISLVFKRGIELQSENELTV